MDVTPPLTAGPAARRPAAPATPVPAAPPSRTGLALRRLGTAVAVLAVAGLAGAACMLSFEPLRSLAMTGGARGDLAYLYPGGFNALLAVALISVFLLRSRRWVVRLQAGVVLTLLIVAAAAANTAVATGVTVNPRGAAVTVAVVPWAMLVLGLWLLLLSVRTPQASEDETSGDLVPFGVERPAAEGRDPVQAPPLEEPVTPQEREAAARHLPEAEPVVGPTPAPETPPVDRLPVPEESAAPSDQPLVPEPRRRDPEAPLRWGDLVRPASGDVLVHPLPEPEAGTQPYPVFIGADEYDPGRYVERHDGRDAGPDAISDVAPGAAAEASPEVDADTQPYPNLREDAPRLVTAEQDPDPAHGAWVAEPEEIADQDETTPAQRRPYPEETTAPPSGRMRSTPLPPEE